MRDIFNLAGIVMPALMLDGKVVGRWKKKERKLRIQLFVPLSPGDRAAVKEKAEALWDDIASLEGLS